MSSVCLCFSVLGNMAVLAQSFRVPLLVPVITHKPSLRVLAEALPLTNIKELGEPDKCLTSSH